MMDEDSYQTGSEALYIEDGEISRVLILANNSNPKRIRYKLRILDVVRESALMNSLMKSNKVGREFECEKVRGIGYSGLWLLSDS